MPSKCVAHFCCLEVLRRSQLFESGPRLCRRPAAAARAHSSVKTPTRTDCSTRWPSGRLKRWFSTGLVMSCLMAVEQLSARAFTEPASNSVAVAVEPIVVKPSEPQLFVDDYLIQSQVGLQRRLRQPVKDNRSAKPLLSLSDLHITAP